MRARNLKPGLFKNEELGTAPPINTVIFEGLWTLADREGRLEDRPLRVHAEINPYRHQSSTVQALDWLHAKQFIHRYRVSGVAYIWIPTFREHQNPHVREPTSLIPPYENRDKEQEDVEAPDKHCASTGPPRDEHESGPSDSGFPLPDSGLLTPTAKPSRRQRAAPRETDISDEDWSRFQEAYPERAGDYRWSSARVHVNAALATGGDTVEAVLDGVKRYSANMAALGKIGTDKVKQAETFCSQRAWREAWKLPKPGNGATGNVKPTVRAKSVAELEAEEAAHADD